ncbi:hypothetical protein [Demetria terragena]|uniref:hypothetical protein n=1 Tax=Demetria terragena TaxID=63959 RepID=UPI0003678501|nr:hypothetical protein [Demetria terragena]
MMEIFSSPLGIPIYLCMVVLFVAFIGHRSTPRRLRIPLREWNFSVVWSNALEGCRVLTTAGGQRNEAREKFLDDAQKARRRKAPDSTDGTAD